MKKYNIEELKEKLERCRNVNLDDVKLEDVDEITSIKIDRRKPSEENKNKNNLKDLKSYENFVMGLNGCYKDCTNCSSKSKCCSHFDKMNLPVLNRKEIVAIERYIKNDDFYNVIENNLFSLKSIHNKCIFYKNGKCSIYKLRPVDCKLFPYDVIKKEQKYYLIIYELDCINTEKFVIENYCDENLIKKIITWIKDFTNDVNYTKMKNYKYKIIKEIDLGSDINGKSTKYDN